MEVQLNLVLSQGLVVSLERGREGGRERGKEEGREEGGRGGGRQGGREEGGRGGEDSVEEREANIIKHKVGKLPSHLLTVKVLHARNTIVLL